MITKRRGEYLFLPVQRTTPASRVHIARGGIVGTTPAAHRGVDPIDQETS
jgi:hypothetical protein